MLPVDPKGGTNSDTVSKKKMVVKTQRDPYPFSSGDSSLQLNKKKKITQPSNNQILEVFSRQTYIRGGKQ